MFKIIASLLLVVISLFGNDKFSDKDMKNYVNLILEDKQKVYTTSELVKSLFEIQARDEFETKNKYEDRINKILGNGIFFVYKKVDKVEYNIDTKVMKFYTPLQGGNTWENEKPNNELIKKGYTRVVLELDFNNNAFPIVEKMKFAKNKYLSPYAYVSMAINEAKTIKTQTNTFFQIIAVKVTPENILKRKTRDSHGTVNGKNYLDLWAEVPMEAIGTAIISLNPKKTIFAFGKN